MPRPMTTSHLRLACDRCRGQKLRCPREGPDSRVCSRCRQADVECTFSPSLRMGRPFGTGQYNRERNRSGKVSGAANTPEREMSDMSSSPLDASMEEGGAGTTLTGLGQSAATSAGPDSSMASSHGGTVFEGISPYIANGNEMRADQEEAMAPNLNQDFTTEHLWFLNEPAGLDLYNLMGTIPQSGADSDAQTIPSSSVGSGPGELFDGLSSIQSLSPESLPSEQRVFGITTGDTFDSTNIPRSTSHINQGSNGSGENVIHQLSDLNLHLYRQLKQVSFSSWMRSGTSPQFPLNEGTNEDQFVGPYPVGEILQSSQRFLELLTIFQSRHQPLEAESPGTTKRPSDILGDAGADVFPQSLRGSESGGGWGGYTSGAAALPQNWMSHHNFSQSQGTRSTDVPSMPGVGPAVDEPPTDLLIITSCYLTIIRLYKVLFDDILDSMADVHHKRAAFESALRDLRVGGFDLSQLGSLSMTVLVHTAVHLLDQIENALHGLDRYPLGNRVPSVPEGSRSMDTGGTFPYTSGTQYHQHINLTHGSPEDSTTASLVGLLIGCVDGGSKLESMDQGRSLRTQINSVKTLFNIS